MAEIAHKQLGEYLAACRESGFAEVCLVFGESFMCRKTADAIVGELIPSESDRAISLDIIDAAEGEGVCDALERLNTFSFFAGKKVILLKSASLFVSGFDAGKHLEKIRSACDDQSMQKAARLLRELTERQGCRPEDLIGAESAGLAKMLKVDPDRYPDLSFIQAVARQCGSEANSKSLNPDDAGVLKAAIEKGFPPNHHLIIVADTVDKRTALFKTIKSGGAVINCQVPTGNRKADRDEQRRVLGQLAKETLERHGKSIAPSAFDRIFELTGFDPRSFAGSLEKMVHYVADKPRISEEDVAAVLERSREDPIYLFTGAVAERNVDSALYYLASLLSSGFHYMQLLAAMTNQTRRMLAVRAFMDGREGKKAWTPAMPYDRFRERVMPAVAEHDASLQAYVQVLSAGLAPETDKGRAAKKTTDLIIAKNPNNPYPVYQSFLQADRFETQELLQALQLLHSADVQLKTTGQSPRATLESVIFKICRQAPA